jgi:hypothetical protein
MEASASSPIASGGGRMTGLAWDAMLGGHLQRTPPPAPHVFDFA